MYSLEKLNFSKNLEKIYLFLIKNGKTRAGQVIETTGLQRSVVYSGLEELTSRGLITKTDLDGVFIYSVNSPRSLVDEAERSKITAENIAKELENIIGVQEREINVYEGNNIIEVIAQKSLEYLENGDTVYFLGAAKYGIQANLNLFWQKYHKKRIEKHINCKILYDKDTDKSIVDARNNLEACEAKYMPFGMDMPMWFNIFGEYVGIIVPSDDPPVAFFIRSEATAKGLRKYFDHLWSIEK